MNPDLRIEKGRAAVAVLTTSGETLSGDMFLQAFARLHDGPEVPVDVLNGPEPFFPLAIGAGDTVLVAKAHVLEVAWEDPGLPPDAEIACLPGTRPVLIELTLVGGAARVGQLHLEMPTARSRLLDFLNLTEERFLVLHAADGVRLVNRALVTRVRPLD